jgi:hypothetical protein
MLPNASTSRFGDGGRQEILPMTLGEISKQAFGAVSGPEHLQRSALAIVPARLRFGPFPPNRTVTR